MKLNTAIDELSRACAKIGLESPVQLDWTGQSLCESIAAILFSGRNFKSVKKPFKAVIISLNEEQVSELEICIKQRLVQLPSSDIEVHCVTLSFLLEEYPRLRHLLAAYIECLAHLLSNALSSSCSDVREKFNRDKLCEQLKVMVQILQFFHDDVDRCFQESSEMSLDLLQASKLCIQMLSQTKVYNDAVRLMAGIYLGTVLNYCQADQTLSQIIWKMYSNILSGAPANITASGVFSDLGFSIPCTSNSHSILTFFLKGIFSCVRSSVFFVHLPCGDKLLHVLFDAICEASELHEEIQFHSLQVLKLWWMKVQGSLKSQEHLKSGRDMAQVEDKHVKGTVQLIFRQWDSPIAGTPALVLRIMTVITDCMKSTGKDETFLHDLLGKLMRLPASIKGKYNFVSLVVTRAGAKVLLQKYPNFLCRIKPLLAVNHMCPVISKTYRTIVADIAARKDVQFWEEILLPGLVIAILDHNLHVRSNAVLYWLPIHLKSFRDSYHKILGKIQEDANKHRVNTEIKYLALMATSKFARRENKLSFTDLDYNLICTGLSHFNDAVRSEAFQVVCCHTKSSERISKPEMELIKSFLPLNMNSDSVVFRQQLEYCVKCIAERIRDGVHPNKRAKSKLESVDDGDYAVKCGDLFKFLYKLSVGSLHPEFTYQRKKTAIDILGTLLNTFYANQKDFPFAQVLFENSNADMLLEMLLDPVPEIRTLASAFLNKFFAFIPSSCLERHSSVAYRLSTSPRSRDNESAANILKVVALRKNSNERKSMLENHLKQLQNTVELMKNDIVTSSRQFPPHGWLLVIKESISSLESDFLLQSCYALLVQLSETTRDLIKFSLDTVFKGDARSDGNSDECLGVSADFCEMTERIEKLTLDNSKDRETLLTDDHETILASFWLCLLRGSSLLAHLALIIENQAGELCLLRSISDTLVKIMTSCRHRGAIEGCYEAFLLVCKSLLCSKTDSYRRIPCDLITKVCINLESATGSNVTRRSAGIPLILEAVLVAEASHRCSELFHVVLKSIVNLSLKVPFAVEDDEKFDIPQVHGLYILKHLFRNSQLGSAVLTYASSVLEIATKSLSSPIWVVRNAATHLFGAVTNRMLGQKNIDGSQVESMENSVSSCDFFCRYPTVGKILSEEMEKSLPSSTLPQPALHPILCLLAKLTYCIDDEDFIPIGFVDLITRFLSSPVYLIRSMAAKALLGLVKSKMVFITTLTDALPERISNSNALHGFLLFLQEAGKADAEVSESRSVFITLINLLKSKSIHPINYSLAIQIVSKYEHVVTEDVLTGFELSSKPLVHQIGDYECQYQKTKLELQLLGGTSAKHLLKKCLNQRNNAMLKAATEWISDHEYDNDLMRLMLDNIQVENTSFLTSIVQVIAAHRNNPIFVGLLANDRYHVVGEMACDFISRDLGLSTLCSGLKLLSVLLAARVKLLPNQSNCEHKHFYKFLTIWIDQVISRTSRNEVSEPLRLSAAEAIEIAGIEVFKRVTADRIKMGDFVCAILSLLHDEQGYIRQPACSFVEMLVENRQHGGLYHTSATKKFLQHFFATTAFDFSSLVTIFEDVFRLKKEHFVKHQSVLFEAEPFNLYEEPVMMAEMVADAFVVSPLMNDLNESNRDVLASELIVRVSEIHSEEQRRLYNLVHIKCLQLASRISRSKDCRKNLLKLFTFFKDISDSPILKAEVTAGLDSLE